MGDHKLVGRGGNELFKMKMNEDVRMYFMHRTSNRAKNREDKGRRHAPFKRSIVKLEGLAQEFKPEVPREFRV